MRFGRAILASIVNVRVNKMMIKVLVNVPCYFERRLAQHVASNGPFEASFSVALSLSFVDE